MSAFLAKLLATGIVLSPAVAGFPAQNVGSDSTQESIAFAKLAQPVYPPVARQARITGDVELTREVKADGSVVSVIVVSGHPLLKQAALDSAQRSQFACRNCGEGAHAFPIFYSFQLGPTSYCTEAPDIGKVDESRVSYPRVTQLENHITLVDQPV